MALSVVPVKKRVTFHFDESNEEADGTQRSTRSVDSGSGVRSISDIWPTVVVPIPTEVDSSKECTLLKHYSSGLTSVGSAVSGLASASERSATVAGSSAVETARIIRHCRAESASIEVSMSMSTSKVYSPEEEVKLASGVFTIPTKYLTDWSSPQKKRVLHKKSIMKTILIDFHVMDQMNLRLEREEKAVAFAKNLDSVIHWKKSKKQVKSSIKVSADGSFLEVSTKKFLRTKRQKIELADIVGIGFGPRTKTFSNLNWKLDDPWRCFSLMGTSGRTWDFQAESEEKALLWFFALQSLIPLSNSYMTWGKLLWMRAIYKTVSASEFSGISLSNHWKRLVVNAKHCAKKAKRLSEMQSFEID